MDKLDLIYQMQAELNVIFGRDTVNDPRRVEWLFDYTEALSSEVQELKDCINWKFWSEEGKEKQYKKLIDSKNAKIEAIDCLHFLITIFQILGMTPEEITNIYKLKHEKNAIRATTNYSVVNKTEDDNNEIKTKITEVL